MPFRTRDFLVFMLTVAFLLIGITSTARMDISKKGQEASVVLFEGENEEVIYQAVLPEPEADTRPSRLAALREKIASLVLSPTEEPAAEVAEDIKPAAEEVGELVSGSVNLCSNYNATTPLWSAKGLLFEIVEGARIVYRVVYSPAVVANEISSSTVFVPPSREVVLQLPLRTYPLTQKSCLNTDVIGVALDGSLIRNNEYSLYRVFGAETLIGYALDGFSIYGLSKDIKTDECGGSSASGEYRYYLSTEREGVLGCFGGIPTSI